MKSWHLYLSPGLTSFFKEQGRFSVYNRQLLKGDVERGKQRDRVLSQPERDLNFSFSLRELSPGVRWSCLCWGTLQYQTSFCEDISRAFGDGSLMKVIWQMQRCDDLALFLSLVYEALAQDAQVCAHTQNKLAACALQPFDFRMNKMLEKNYRGRLCLSC